MAERRYRYDAVGQLEHIEDSRKGLINYRYDPVGRLIAAIGPLGTETFAFDPASNIIDPGSPRHARTPGAVKASPVVPDSVDSTLPAEVPRVLGNLLKEYAGTHFEYDARGNLIGKRSPVGRQEYEWDGFNRLHVARVEEAGRQHEARYFYDSFGRRIGKDVDGVRTVFGWDGDQLAYESNETGATQYVYEPETFVPLAQYVTAQPVAGIQTPVWQEGEPYVPEKDPLQRVPERQSDAHLFYYHCDQIGTPLLMTDEVGEVVWEASYRAWGEAREVIARASKAAGVEPRNPIRFQGQQEDAETGLRYNRYRYYDPVLGRFVSRDPIGLVGGLNAYQYAPNPGQWIDPLGLARKCQLGSYGGLTGKANARDELDAHEFVRNEALEQMGLTPEGVRNKANPSIALPRPMHTEVHKNENALAALHLGVGRDEFQFGENGLPTKRQMDVWQGALRQAGVPAARARELRRQAGRFLSRCPCPCN